jgi:hypothetical protein
MTRLLEKIALPLWVAVLLAAAAWGLILNHHLAK